MARLSVSPPTLRELVRIAFVLAVLCLVVSGVQYAFVRWQASKRDLSDLKADAKSITAAIRYTTAPDLAYFNKAYIDAGPYMAINDDGTIINIYPGFRNSSVVVPQFLPNVQLPWYVNQDANKVIRYTIGNRGQVLT